MESTTDLVINVVWNGGKAQIQAAQLKDTVKGLTDAVGQSSAAASPGVDSLTSSFNKLNETLSGLQHLTSVFMGFEVVKTLTGSLIEAQIALQQIHYSLLAATGSSQGAAEAFGFISGEAQRLGIAVDKIGASYGSFAVSAKQAGVAAKDMNGLFTAASEAATVFHLSGTRLHSTFYALEQMMSMGVIRTQELKIQLGQALPGVYEAFANRLAAMGKDMRKELQAGALDMRTYAPVLIAAFHDIYSNRDVEAAAKGLNAELGRLQTAIFNFKTVASGGIFQELTTDIVVKLRKGLESVAEGGKESMVPMVATMGTLTVAASSLYQALHFLGMKIGSMGAASKAQTAEAVQLIAVMRQEIEAQLELANATLYGARAKEEGLSADNIRVNAGLRNIEVIKQDIKAELELAQANYREAEATLASAEAEVIRTNRKVEGQRVGIETTRNEIYAINQRIKAENDAYVASYRNSGRRPSDLARIQHEQRLNQLLVEKRGLESELAMFTSRLTVAESELVKVEQAHNVALAEQAAAYNVLKAAMAQATAASVALGVVTSRIAAALAVVGRALGAVWRMMGGWWTVLMMTGFWVYNLITKETDLGKATDDLTRSTMELKRAHGDGLIDAFEKTGKSVDNLKRKLEEAKGRLQEIEQEIAHYRGETTDLFGEGAGFWGQATFMVRPKGWELEIERRRLIADQETAQRRLDAAERARLGVAENNPEYDSAVRAKDAKEAEARLLGEGKALREQTEAMEKQLKKHKDVVDVKKLEAEANARVNDLANQQSIIWDAANKKALQLSAAYHQIANEKGKSSPEAKAAYDEAVRATEAAEKLSKAHADTLKGEKDAATKAVSVARERNKEIEDENTKHLNKQAKQTREALEALDKDLAKFSLSADKMFNKASQNKYEAKKSNFFEEIDKEVNDAIKRIEDLAIDNPAAFGKTKAERDREIKKRKDEVLSAGVIKKTAAIRFVNDEESDDLGKERKKLDTFMNQYSPYAIGEDTEAPSKEDKFKQREQLQELLKANTNIAPEDYGAFFAEQEKGWIRMAEAANSFEKTVGKVMKKVEQDIQTGLSNAMYDFLTNVSDLGKGFEKMGLDFAKMLAKMTSDLASSTLITLLKKLGILLGKAIFNTSDIPAPGPGAGDPGGNAMLNEAEGGYISGPGTSTSDSIPAMLSNGEYVISAASVQKYGVQFLDAINERRAAPPSRHYASGGYVGSGSVVTATGGSASAIVNITNTTGEPVEAKRTTGSNGEEILEIVVGKMVQDIRQGGPLGKTIQSTWGLSKKGVSR